MNILLAINDSTRLLRKKNIKNPKLDSEILMSKVINKDRKYILLNQNKKIGEEKLIRFENLIKQRGNGKPIAYLIGKKDFWKHEFDVTENVLIPRPDSEIVIDQVLKFTKNKSKLSILDIGVGSGCLLLSILKEQKKFYGVGVDVSKKCLNICQINSHKLALKNRLKLFKSDIDNFNYGKYDLIISNPPYIKKLELKYLDKDVVDFEPKLALDGGLEGLSEIKKVIVKTSELIKKNGLLILEIGFDQKNKVKKILIENGFYINKVVKDLAKNDRCIVSTKK